MSLGTNLGDKEKNLRDAVHKIEEQIGKVISLSAFYMTAPWGFESDNSFLNAAVCIETELLPLEVLQKTQEIERELGRTHKSTGGVYSDRLIDIDLLMYDDLILSATSPSGAELNLPHPLMAERDFVMKHTISFLAKPSTSFSWFSLRGMIGLPVTLKTITFPVCSACGAFPFIISMMTSSFSELYSAQYFSSLVIFSSKAHISSSSPSTLMTLPRATIRSFGYKALINCMLALFTP